MQLTPEAQTRRQERERAPDAPILDLLAGARLVRAIETIRRSPLAWVLSPRGWKFLYRCYRLGRAGKPLPLHDGLNVAALVSHRIGLDDRRPAPARRRVHGRRHG